VLPGLHAGAQDRLLRWLIARAGGRTTQHASAGAFRWVRPYVYLCYFIYKIYIICIRYSCVDIYFVMWFGRDPGDGHDGASGSRRHRSARVSDHDPGDGHDGASGSRRHRSARVSDHDPGDGHHGPWSGAVTTVWHAGSARDRPWCTPAERWHYAALLADVGSGMAGGTQRLW
jgi:hypothetical protein